ncbi:MAG: hypothetical protein JSR90_01145 [Proteobacteria bacterium]|nr:hypothetical protein [Pseudomonadota bacterium]
MTAFYRYRIYGLVVESALRLSSVEEVPRDGGEASIRMLAAPPGYFETRRPNTPPDPLDWIHHAVLDDGSVYMKAEGVFETVIAPDGRYAMCASLGGVDARSLEANLVNFVLSASLTLQGEEPLHSTVVEIDGRAVGLLGLSGAGKSTLAAFLISRGADLVTDDMLRVTFEDGRVFAHPGPYRLKLFDDPGRRFLPGAVADGHFNPLSGKLMMQPRPVPAPRSAPVPLAGLIHLGSPGDVPAGGMVSLARLGGLDLAKTVISSTMDNRYSAPRRLERQLRFAARIADALPVYALHYPRSFDVMDEVAQLIRRTLPP